MEKGFDVVQFKREQVFRALYKMILLKGGNKKEKNGSGPGGNAGCRCRTADTQLGKTEFSEDETVIQNGVENRCNRRNVHRNSDLFDVSQKAGKNNSQHNGRVGETGNSDVGASAFDNGGFLIEKRDNRGRKETCRNKEQNGYYRSGGKCDTENTPHGLVVLDSPILCGENRHTRTKTERNEVQKPAPLTCHSDRG